MDARRRQHVAAIASNIDPRGHLAGGISDVDAGRHSEIDMAPAGGDGLDGGRQRAVRSFQLAQFCFRIHAIDVANEYAGDSAGGDCNVAVWIAPPPRLDNFRVFRRIKKAVCRGR